MGQLPWQLKNWMHHLVRIVLTKKVHSLQFQVDACKEPAMDVGEVAMVMRCHGNLWRS